MTGYDFLKEFWAQEKWDGGGGDHDHNHGGGTYRATQGAEVDELGSWASIV